MSELAEAPGNGEIGALLAQASDAATKAHEARQRADDDASYSHKAKVASEEHSKAIAALKGQAEADAGWFTATKQGADQAQAVIVQVRAEAEAAQRTITEAVAEVEKARLSVREASEAAASALEEVETAAGFANTHSKTAAAYGTAAGVAKGAAEAAAEKVGELLQEVVANAEKVKGHASEADEALAAATAHRDTAKGLVDAMSKAETRATQVLDIIEKHERDLAALKAEGERLNARIESLLPNAASAGLAYAFKAQKARFDKPQLWWLVTFVVSIVALLGSSLFGLPNADGSWDLMAKHFVNRLPLIGPLVWLAVYAGRHYGLALRLQEEYAYKEAMSTAFEGYKREMTSVAGGDQGSAGPLVTLCDNVLRTLGQRPGRIYEGKHEDITALTPVATAVRDSVQAAAGAVRGQQPAAGAGAVGD